jgi:hypothetical protein
MPFVLVADLVAQARDEDGMPVVPVFVYSLIEERGKSGVVMRGRPVDGAGEPGAEVDIPTGDFHRMRFPIASMEHPHDTFWNASGQLAYVEIKADPERLGARGTPRPGIAGAAQSSGRGNREIPDRTERGVELVRTKKAKSDLQAAQMLFDELLKAGEVKEGNRVTYIERVRKKIGRRKKEG